MAVVDGGIEHIDARAQGCDDGLGVLPVGGVVRFAKVSAEPDRRQPQFAGDGRKLAKMPGIVQRGMAMAVTGGGFGRGVSGEHGG